MAGDRFRRFLDKKTVRMAATPTAPAGVDVKLTGLLTGLLYCGIYRGASGARTGLRPQASGHS